MGGWLGGLVDRFNQPTNRPTEQSIEERTHHDEGEVPVRDELPHEQGEDEEADPGCYGRVAVLPQHPHQAVHLHVRVAAPGVGCFGYGIGVGEYVVTWRARAVSLRGPQPGESAGTITSHTTHLSEPMAAVAGRWLGGEGKEGGSTGARNEREERSLRRRLERSAAPLLLGPSTGTLPVYSRGEVVWVRQIHRSIDRFVVAG